jgi:ABC-type sugar transport system substrate-binding protein
LITILAEGLLQAATDRQHNNDQETVMANSRRMVCRALGALALTAGIGALSLAAPGAYAQDKPITLGFAQVGAESAWRTANTESIKSAAADAKINLKFSDAQQKQENQIKAIRSYIAQKVDVIAFSPVVESGWEPILLEAKAAKIPVILTDRNIDVKDTSLYVTMIGSDAAVTGSKTTLKITRDRSTSPNCREPSDLRLPMTGIPVSWK